MDIGIIFKIAAIGLLVTIINQLLKKSEREEFATIVTLAGLIIVMLMVVSMIGNLFDTLKSILNLY